MAEEIKTVKTEKPNTTLWQTIKFVMVAALAGVTETVTYAVLVLGLKGMTKEVSFVGQKYLMGAFIAYLASALIGQIVSFIVNRKATFKANNNIGVALIIFVIMVAVIVVGQSYFGPMLNAYFANLAGGIENKLLHTLCADFAGKAILMFCTMVFSFIMNKFFINKRTEEKEPEIEEETREEK